MLLKRSAIIRVQKSFGGFFFNAAIGKKIPGSRYHHYGLLLQKLKILQIKKNICGKFYLLKIILIFGIFEIRIIHGINVKVYQIFLKS